MNVSAISGVHAPTVAKSTLRWIAAVIGAFAVFGLLMVVKGVNPLEAYRSMWQSLMTDLSLTSVLVKGGPLILAALAVTVPAKAGMVNVGGEGQRPHDSLICYERV